MISPLQWQIYKNAINAAHDSFNQDVVIWHRFIGGFQRYGEDDQNNETFLDITLKTLVSYNVFRTWPITKETSAGSVDLESATLIFNKKYLEDLGYLNSDGFFAMDPGKDEFTLGGVRYRPSGETEVAQAGDDPLMFYVILIRKKVKTADPKY